jgi:hypothetical protein
MSARIINPASAESKKRGVLHKLKWLLSAVAMAFLAVIYIVILHSGEWLEAKCSNEQTPSPKWAVWLVNSPENSEVSALMVKNLLESKLVDSIIISTMHYRGYSIGRLERELILKKSPELKNRLILLEHSAFQPLEQMLEIREFTEDHKITELLYIVPPLQSKMYFAIHEELFGDRITFECLNTEQNEYFDIHSGNWYNSRKGRFYWLEQWQKYMYVSMEMLFDKDWLLNKKVNKNMLKSEQTQELHIQKKYSSSSAATSSVSQEKSSSSEAKMNADSLEMIGKDVPKDSSEIQADSLIAKVNL